MSKRSFVAIALLLGASLIGCQTTGLAPLLPQDAIVSTSLGAKDGGTIVVRLATQSALRIMAEAVKLADVDHFTVKLYKAPVGTPDPINDELAGTTMTLPATGVLTGEFKGLPLGEYYLAVDALDASGNSLLERKDGPELSAKVPLSTDGQIEDISVNVQLRHATGGESTITITAPDTFSGTKSYGLTLVDRLTKEVVSHYRSASSTIYLKALKDGDYDLWIHAADEGPSKKATPARPFPITVSGGTVAGPLITAAFDPKMAQISPNSWNNLWAIAVAPNNDVYLSDANTTAPSVYNASTNTLIAGGSVGDALDGADAVGPVLRRPQGIAIQSNGDIFIADRTQGKILRISSGKIYTATSGASSATGIAVNSNDNLFYSTRVAPNINIFQLGSPSIAVDSLPSNHLNANMSCDSLGNLYFVAIDSGNESICMYVKQPGFYFGQSRGAGRTTLPSGGLTSIQGIAVDAASNLYVAGMGPGNNPMVKMVTREGASYTIAGPVSASTGLVVGAVPTQVNLGGLKGLAVNAEGSIYLGALGQAAGYQVWQIN